MNNNFFKKIIILTLFLILINQKNIFAQNQNVLNLNNEELNKKKIELEQKIKEKNTELENINRELQNTQINLEKVQQQKKNLQNEIQKLNQAIKQLELNIVSDTINIEKLELEIESLNYDIKNINISIEKKKNAIIKALQEIQKSENKNFLMIILTNNSLADSFSEIQNLFDLKNQLRIDTENLSKLESELNNRLELTRNKKEDIEIRKNNLIIRQAIAKDQQQEKNLILSQTKNQESLYQKHLEELQKQQDALEEQIYQIEEELKKTFNIEILPQKRSGFLAWPILLRQKGGIGIISQKYGQTPYSFKLYKGRPHNGLDIAAPVGTPVYAADDGIVIHIDNNDKSRWAKYQYGKYILIKHSSGLATLYAHLSEWIVKKNQEVKRGQLIGYSGNTGYSTGPHLHFGVYWAQTISLKSISPANGLIPVGVTVNPEDYL